MEKRKDANVSTLKLKETLKAMEERYWKTDNIFGMTLLTNPGYISASRNIMFTSHLRQFVTLLNSDFPKVFTNYENLVGKQSTGYYKAKSKMKVVDKIPRFTAIDNNHLYLLFVYDKKTDTYDVIQKQIVEDLTEKFGFPYDNRVMDKLEVNEEIQKDDVLYKTPSYDEDGNYCYGKNVKFMYLLSTKTIEDAIICSESFSKFMLSKEVETVKVSLNDNDILCNLYGDNEIYQCFPDIGEKIKDKIVCARRRRHDDQLLYDLKKSNLRKINVTSDKPFFSEGTVVDINVYCNKPLDEVPDNMFYKQIKKYLKMQKEFYLRVYDRCKKIIDSGSKYGNDIAFWFSKAKNYLDDNYKYREEDNSVFSNIVIEFLVERTIPLSVGQKTTGRYGNKGVISVVLPDEQMPYIMVNGKKETIHVILNSLGVINRENSFQLMEQSINFICNRARERLRDINDIKEKEEIIFKLIKYFNDDEYKKVKDYYNGLSLPEKNKFFTDIENEGVFIHIPPLWEDEPLFDRLWKIYDEFDWIKPYDVFLNKWGRSIKMLRPQIIGDMYLIKMKQTSKKGFSVRSTGSLGKKGIPEKSNKAKIHEELYSKTPIRLGEQETLNSIIGVPPEILAQLHMLYRSSVMGRKELGKQLMTSLKPIKDISHKNIFKNRNIEILQAYLKALGLKLEFEEDPYTIDIYTKAIKDYRYNGKLYICTRGQFEDMQIEEDVRDDYENGTKLYIGTPKGYEDMIAEQVALEKEKRSGLYIEI